MPAELNGLPANGTANGINGHADELSNSTPANAAFDSIPDVVAAFANGEFVVVLDSPDRENEGDLIIAAESLTPEKAAFMIRYSSGYICAPLTVSRAAALHLPQMVADNADPNRTAYAISIDADHESVSTGISAQDRSLTCRMLADPNAKASEFRRPGHILPLQAREGGVRVRRGHTEAAVDLCRLAGKQPVGVICEMINDGESVDGRPELVGSGMMRTDDCLKFGKKWGIKVCTIEDMVTWIEENEGKLPVQ
ncbi:DHBP synthase RibB-like alpha/beta domain-containing protein [Boeremia exigua]|uniref:DHBP synthase RibB-like alpha/beta domain-containing protein n=1 Tax=Boeremia exigua TaxID=749465 RepID=UPI001E8CC207|nr:DHBP synthase RibB-like alpha/beta domain-containing protein [Boeremia exigua]KAH6633297.1 DHBP synthase RibB-like alpha/beta domain-containing protein [Boeremia exigua]